MTTLTLVGARQVRVSGDGIAAFNRGWPCSELRPSRAYWFQFDKEGDLVDHDVPHTDDGSAAAAIAEDCKAWLFVGVTPSWAPGQPDASELGEHEGAYWYAVTAPSPYGERCDICGDYHEAPGDDPTCPGAAR